MHEISFTENEFQVNYIYILRFLWSKALWRPLVKPKMGLIQAT